MSRSRRTQRVAPIPSTDLGQLRGRIRALAENRPAVYRMLDGTGRIIYVGKAKRLRTRLLSYFRAEYPDDKAARILYAAADIAWDYVPSEFAAYLGELRQIRRHRPYFNHRGTLTGVRCSSRCRVGRRRGSRPVERLGRTTGAATARSEASAARWRQCGRSTTCWGCVTVPPTCRWYSRARAISSGW